MGPDMLATLQRRFPLGAGIALLFGVLVLAGCSPSDPSPGETASATLEKPVQEAQPMEGSAALSQQSQASTPKPAPILTREQQLLKFGRDWAEAMTKRKEETAGDAWDIDAMLTYAMGAAGAEFTKERRELFRTYKEAEKKKPGGVMWQAFGEPWEVIRYHEVAGEARLMCRALVGGGLTYVDLVPVFGADGKPKLVDAYLFSSGEFLTDSLRRVLLPQLARMTQMPLEALGSASPSPLMRHFDSVMGFLQSASQQDHVTVIEKFGALPPEVQNEKFVLIQYLGSIIFLMNQQGKDPQLQRLYYDGMLNFEVQYGDDPAYLLMAMEYHLFKEDYVAAMETVDRLDATVGGDPYLDSLRADILAMEHRLEEALTYAIQARERAPWVEDTYWQVLDIQFQLQDWLGAAAEMDRLVHRFNYKFEIEAQPYYSAFLQSKVGQNWLQDHKQEFAN